MNNLVLVEGKNDKLFMDVLISKLGLIDLKCEKMGGTGHLKTKLASIKRDLEKDNVRSVGIIFDADDVGIEKRRSEIETVVNEVFDPSSAKSFSTYILNVEGRGELTTLLRMIKTHPSPKADCLESWKQCVEKESGEIISAKEIDKLWMNLYNTWDCNDKTERKNASKNCGLDACLKKGNYDLDHILLKELCNFLRTLVVEDEAN